MGFERKPRLVFDSEWLLLDVEFRRSNDGALCGWLIGRGKTIEEAWASRRPRGGRIVTYYQRQRPSTHLKSPIAVSGTADTLEMIRNDDVGVIRRIP